jgi:hypothetical protein
MRTSIILFLTLTLSLVAGTFAATVTYFTDAKCLSSVSSPFNGVVHPIVADLNQCILAYNIPPSVRYSKNTICSSTGATFENFLDNKCTDGKQIFNYPLTGATTCMTAKDGVTLPPGVLSMRITCPAPTPSPVTPSVASEASVAIFTLLSALAFVLVL